MLKKILTSSLLLLLPFEVFAEGTDNDSKPFQVVMSVAWPVSSYDSNSTAFSVAPNQTAIIEYINCHFPHGPAGSPGSSVHFWVKANSDGILSSHTILRTDLDQVVASGGAFNAAENSSNFVSACIGRKCESLDGRKYLELGMSAVRSQDQVEETMECLVFGNLF